MRPIRAIWFDLDDTLYDHTYSVCRGLDAIRRTYPTLAERTVEEMAVLYNDAINAVYGEYLSGEIDFREMRRRKLKLFYEAAGVDDNAAPSMDQFHRIYDEAYGSHRRATPGSLALLDRCRERGIALAVVTNGTQTAQEDKLRAIGLEWMIPNLLTAERAGTAKPDPRIYEWALAQTGQVASDVLMAGDSLENDVGAALRCGLSAVLYAPGAKQQTVLTAHGAAPILNQWNGLLDLIGEDNNRAGQAWIALPGWTKVRDSDRPLGPAPRLGNDRD